MSARRLWSVAGNSQRLDGGAMFGNAPRELWSGWAVPDELNRVPLACRGLLVVEEQRTVLFESGIGAFFEPRLRHRYGVVEDEHRLLESLATAGIEPSNVDVVVLSHLHFDHAGGILSAYQPERQPSLIFPKARYVVGRDALDRAREPHPRDRASFIPGLPELLLATNRLELVTSDRSETLGSGYRFWRSDGHTPGMLLGEIASADGPIVFVADLAPGRPWVHAPITMAYDRFPERVVDEKLALYEDWLPRGARLFFTHDPQVAMARLVREARGRFGTDEERESVVGELI